MTSKMQRRISYEALIQAGAADLGEDEFWVIDHDLGPLWDTASKRFDTPIIIFCNALRCDWDAAQEDGYRLAKLKREKQHADT